MRLVIFLYTFSIVYFLFEGSFKISFYIALTIPIFIVLYLMYKKAVISKYKNKIEKAISDIVKGVKVEPFIKVNSAYFEILVLVPGISRGAAKKVKNYRRKKRIMDFVEFADLTGLELQNYKVAKQILKF